MKTTIFSLFILVFFAFSCGGSQSEQQDNQETETAATEESTTEASTTEKESWSGDSQTEGMSSATPMEESGQTWHDGLAYIEEYLGRRPAAVDLWQTQPLQNMLENLLGDHYQAYLDIMQEAMPLAKDRVIYTMGVAPDDAVPGIGYLLIDTENDKLRAFGVFGDMKIDAQSPGENLYLPEAVKAKVEQVLGVEKAEELGALMQ